LAALEEWQTARGGEFLLVTQNVDLLHERAGSTRLIKIHGTVDRLRCSRDGCRLGAPAGSLAASEADFSPFLAAPRLDALPRCPACGALLRAHALLFDEIYDDHQDYRFREVLQALERIALVLFVGTSFSVGITDIVLREALGWRVPVLSIDPGAPPPVSGVMGLRWPAEEVLPAAVSLLSPAGGR
jgi:NAD-dependent deacetylase